MLLKISIIQGLLYFFRGVVDVEPAGMGWLDVHVKSVVVLVMIVLTVIAVMNVLRVWDVSQLQQQSILKMGNR